MKPLRPERVQRLLSQVPGWKWEKPCESRPETLVRRFEFPGFHRTMGFINAMAWIATRQGHHPDIQAGYNFCTVRLTTHAIKGLSENDFICAARINQLLES